MHNREEKKSDFLPFLGVGALGLAMLGSVYFAVFQNKNKGFLVYEGGKETITRPKYNPPVSPLEKKVEKPAHIGKTVKEVLDEIVKDKLQHVSIYVGNNAPASDVIASLDILTTLHGEYRQKNSGYVANDSAKLVSEFTTYGKFNILVGTPEHNSLMGDFWETQKREMSPPSNGLGLLEVSRLRDGNYVLLVSGGSPEHVRLVAKAISDRDNHNFDCHRVYISKGENGKIISEESSSK